MAKNEEIVFVIKWTPQTRQRNETKQNKMKMKRNKGNFFSLFWKNEGMQ
jgi:hypothetical protein